MQGRIAPKEGQPVDHRQGPPGDRRLIEADPHRQIMLTHGTDTMVEMAMLLCAVGGKVIMLAGATQPVAFKQSDAAFNVGCAILAVQTLPDGVYVVVNGRVFDPQRARKNLELDRFEEST